MEEEEIKAFEETQNELKELGLKSSNEDKAEKKEEEIEDKTKETASKEEEKAEAEEAEDKESEDEETEEETVKFQRPKQVPIKDFKEYKKTIKEELQKDFNQKLDKMREEMSKATPDEDKTDDLEADIEALAQELDFDKEKTRKIVETARKGLALSKEDRELLGKVKEYNEFIEKSKQDSALKEQVQIFNEEFQILEPELTKLYPNATPEQKAQAKEELDKLAHSEKYHKLELTEILNLKKSTFDKVLFSPKQKTFESGRPQLDEEFDNELPKFNPNWTPSQVEAYEKKRQDIIDNSPQEKLLIRGLDGNESYQ